MTSPDPASTPSSLWAAVTPPRPLAQALEGGIDTDVVVIGAGFTGLSTALRLADRGRSVAVLEAATVGFGASGRNNGQIIPTMTAAEPDVVEARFGDAGARFVGMVRDSAAELFDLVRREAIDCEAEQTGWFQPAHSPGRVKLSALRVEAWGKRGAPVRLLDRTETIALLGSEAWYGGMLNTSGGHVNPLALARGLAAACERKGVRLYEGSTALRFERRGDRWAVKLARGEVTASALVLASNAYTDFHASGLQPRLAREVVPVLSWQMATRPLTDAERATIVPGRQAVSDTHGDLHFFRYDARHRLVTGGALALEFNAGARLQTLIGQRLARLFPNLGVPSFSYVWSGRIGMTTDRMPRLHRLGPDAWAWAGCNGRGVALAISLGRELAAAVSGVPASQIAMPVTDVAPIPFHALGRFVAPLVLLQRRWQDAREVQLG